MASTTRLDQWCCTFLSMKSKSIITITDDGQHIKIECVHDPVPSGNMSEWSIPAMIADAMCKFVINRTNEDGIQPFYEHYKNSLTGHQKITTRAKETDEPDKYERTDSETDGNDTSGGGKVF